MNFSKPHYLLLAVQHNYMFEAPIQKSSGGQYKARYEDWSARVDDVGDDLAEELALVGREAALAVRQAKHAHIRTAQQEQRVDRRPRTALHHAAPERREHRSRQHDDRVIVQNLLRISLHEP